ncbi:MAG: TlpA disulfide reductase family protein [Candidatus Accumulibacter sp. UW26]|jgi:thiol-disulfide isomerase/thioredoxin
MKLLVLAGVVALATFATLGWMGYRLLTANRLPPTGVPPGLISSQQLPQEEGQAVADAIMRLTLPDLAGRPQAIAQWRGKVLVVNYWASWCAPCIEEMPVFSRLQARYAAQGVQFVGIGLDEVARMQAFVARTPVAYPLLVGDPDGSQQSGLRVRGLPYTVVIDRHGHFDSSRLGRLDEATLVPVLERLIAP